MNSLYSTLFHNKTIKQLQDEEVASLIRQHCPLQGTEEHFNQFILALGDAGLSIDEAKFIARKGRRPTLGDQDE